MSRLVPANKLDAAQQAAIVDAFARGLTPRKVAEQVGCAHSTAQSYQRSLHGEIEQRKRELAEAAGDEDVGDEDVGDDLDETIAEAVKVARATVEAIRQATADGDDLAQNATALARLLKELHVISRLRDGQPTSHARRETENTTTVVEIGPPAGGAGDPFGPLRRF